MRFLPAIFHPHDPILVLLAFAVAVLASFVSLELAGQIKRAAPRARPVWLVAAGVAMGGGIWSMHFIAMIALELPFAVAYEPSLTVISLVMAMVVATAGLQIVFWRAASWRGFISGGVVMGLGVAAMHYTGMAALVLPAAVHYHAGLVALSIAIAIAAATAALWLAFSVNSLPLKLGSAVLMGTAVCGMHFTGMAAFICGKVDPAIFVAPGLSANALAGGVAGTSGAILLLGLGAALYDRRVSRLTMAAMIANDSKQRVDALLRNAADLAAVLDENGTVTFVSAASQLAGQSSEITLGTNIIASQPPEMRPRSAALLAAARARPGQAVRGEFLGRDGASWFEVTVNDQFANPVIRGFVINLRDITAQKNATALIEQALAQAQEARRLAEEHASEVAQANAKTRAAEAHAQALEAAHAATRAAEEQARQLARHDALTGMANRRVFSAELQLTLARAQGNTGTSTLMLIDLDGFKKINDLEGRHAGDAVLCEVARRIEAVMRKQDSAARLDGDEFGIIAEGEAELQAHLDGAMRLAGRLLAAIRQPISGGERKLEISASIGIAACRAETADTGSLLRAADLALSRAKLSGGGTFRFFEQSMDDELRAQEALEKDLATALEAQNITPYYQPLVDLHDQQIYGFEALARWNDPVRGFVSPDVFIPIIEQLGLMSQLTESMLRQVCRDARHWPQNIHISVNFPPSEFTDPILPSRILTILEQEGMEPERLEVEITETALVSDIDLAKAILTTLQGFGIGICLDDFGTGYSSLYHLRELKFDKIKIDRSFVQAMRESVESEKIVDAILSLAHNLNLPTVAEGIEDPEILRLLAAKGCEYGQGYYFGKAMPAGDVAEKLESQRTAFAGWREPGLVAGGYVTIN